MKKCKCGSNHFGIVEFEIHGPQYLTPRRTYECQVCGRLEDIEILPQEDTASSVERHIAAILDAYVDGDDFSSIRDHIDGILLLVGSNKTAEDLLVH